MSKVYDVIVLGAGPAGLAAGLYAGRSRLSTLVIEKGKDGGQIAITDDIENYPGQIVEGESGPSLIARMTQQCEKFGVERACQKGRLLSHLPVLHAEPAYCQCQIPVHDSLPDTFFQNPVHKWTLHIRPDKRS